MNQDLVEPETLSSPARRKPRKLQVRSTRTSVDESAMDLSSLHRRSRTDIEALESFNQPDHQLPALPIDEDSYFHENTSSLNNTPRRRSDEPSEMSLQSEDGHDLDEGEMRRHLMDVESSFLPESAPVQTQEQNLGLDDTYTELVKPGKTPLSDSMQASLMSPESLPERDHARSQNGERESETPESQHLQESFDSNDTDEESGDSFMSPAAAASYRSDTRQASAQSNMSPPPARANQAFVQSVSDMSSSYLSGTSTRERASSKGSPGQAQDVPLPSSRAASSLGSSQVLSPRRLRPAFLSSRQVSQRSSRSTATITSEFSGSDTTVGADYALQTGGARPASGSITGSGNKIRTSDFLNRLPSMGSDASYMSRDADTFPTIARLSGSMNQQRLSTRFEEDEEPRTPRPSTARNDAPTDTILAQRIENIRVPETVARDFRARNPTLTDRRPASSDGPAPSASFGGDRPRRTLTLKEQNGKIDKLTKENFDLKLKIHFLDQALRSHSDEGVQELIDRNVQLQTDLANERRESQSMRRKIRELERKAKELEQGLEDAQNARNSSRNDELDDDDPTLQAEMHEEILYLRQQLDYSENQVTTMREEIMTEKLEKRKMAEHMRSMAGHRAEDNSGVRETMEMWQDLLNAETGRREQSEEDARKLREELAALRIDRASPAAHRLEKRPSRNNRLSVPQSADEESNYSNGVSGTESSHTLVDNLRHENAELRRDLGAQTSMLTSRNRERERLQQEIEDLKLLQRKSDGARSMAGDSIFERSISRAHQRAPSLVGDNNGVNDAERDEWDRKEGQLRDQNAELRLKYQELERTHNTHLQYVSALEGDFQEMENDLNDTTEDLKALVTERDDALQSSEELQNEYQRLELEAVAEIEKLEKEVENIHSQLQGALKRAQKTQTKLDHTTDGYKGLQGELREITQSVMNLEDEKQANVRTIESLEQQLAETEDELQKWEEKCKELDQKNRKLEITQESLHSEITFLREEQESDKIKIGELEDALNAAHQNIQDEQEKLREMEDEIVQEREQRDVLENQSKEEVQKVLDGLNTEGGKTKDEVRKLRRALSAKEVEASSWKQRLEELEENLRHVLGDVNGTKQSMLAEIEKLQRDLEQTANYLDRTKMDVADKDRLLRHRDGLLESTSLESRRLSDLLDKERMARKHDLELFEKESRGKATTMRTIAQHESRVLELETAYSQDKRKMSALEQQYRDQLSDRNALLLALWNRLSTLCGTEWSHSNSLVNGEVPSTEVIARGLPSFNKNILAAVKRVEALMGDFKQRIKAVERDLNKDYQTLEHNLDLRVRRLDQLERAIKETQARMAEEAAATAAAAAAASQRPQTNRSVSSRSMKGSEEIAKLKSEAKLLKAELKFHRQHPSAMAQQLMHQQSHGNNHIRTFSSGSSGAAAANANAAAPSSSSIKPPSPARTIMSTLLRHHSTSAIDQHSQLAQAAHAASAATGLQGQSTSIALDQTPLQRVETGASEQRWIHRLKEMERRLKAEREARLLDRRGARQRLEERSAENEELRMMLEREKRRESYGGGGAVGGGGDESGSGAEDEFFDRRGGVGERM
jgi:chromosome segregation ATPase